MNNKHPNLDTPEAQRVNHLTAAPGWQEDPETVGAFLAARIANQSAPGVPAGFANGVMRKVRTANPLPVDEGVSAAFVGVTISFFSCLSIAAVEGSVWAGTFLAGYALTALKAFLVAWAMIEITVGSLGIGTQWILMPTIFLLAVGLCGICSAFFVFLTPAISPRPRRFTP